MKKYLVLVFCLIFVFSALVGCKENAEVTSTEEVVTKEEVKTEESTTEEEVEIEETEEAKGTIKFGVLAPITGTYAEYGTGFKVAIQMAVDEINAAGGVNGYMLEFEVKDSQGDATVSSDLARSYADDDEIMAIIGDFSSGCCMANAPIVDEAGLVQLSPTASHTDYAGMSEYTFSIMGRQDGEAPFFAEKICKEYMGASNVGIMYVNSDWGNSALSNFEIKANEIGLDIVETAGFIKDEADFSSLITKLRDADPEILVLMGQSAEVSLIVNQIKSVGWDIPLTTLGPGPSQQLLDNCGENAEGLVVTLAFYFDPDNAKVMAWKDTFESMAGFSPTTHPVVAYDSVYLLAEAIRKCGDEVTRQGIRDNLAESDFEGMAGRVVFNPAGDIYRNYMITVVVDGQFEVQGK